MRAYVSRFTIRLILPTGAMTTVGRLLSIQATKKSAGRGEGSYKLCSPEGNPVKTAYIDSETGVIVPREECKHYIQGNLKAEEPEVKKILSDEEWAQIKEAKVSTLPKNVLEVTIHPASAKDQLWATSRNNSFLFVPDDEDPENVNMANVFKAMLESDDYLLVSVANIRNNEGFYRLAIWRGQITLEPVVYTDDLNPHETVSTEMEGDLPKVALGVAKALAVDFDAGVYVNERKARLMAIEAGEAGDSVADRIAEAKRATSVQSMLTDFLETV